MFYDQFDISPPTQSYADFVESLPGRRAPVPNDIFTRWDLRRYRCSSRKTGSPAQPIEHTKEFEQVTTAFDTTCLCGAKFIDIGPAGKGEQRAYIAWLLQIMESDESDLFRMTGIRADLLVQLAIVPVIRALVGEKLMAVEA